MRTIEFNEYKTVIENRKHNEPKKQNNTTTEFIETAPARSPQGASR